MMLPANKQTNKQKARIVRASQGDDDGGRAGAAGRHAGIDARD
jgi:hypothetical protein